MNVVTITQAASNQPPPDGAVRAWLDHPKTGSQSDIYAIDISGWAVEHRRPIAAVDVVHGNATIRTVPVQIPRPDVSAHFGERFENDNCGFSTRVGVVGLPSEFQLRLDAVLQDASRVPFARIQGRRQPLPSNLRSTLNPLMITSLGRTGTTWLMRLLSEHPQIVVQKIHPYETRAAGYWVHMLKVLSEPANHGQSSNRENVTSNRWWIGHHPYYLESLTRHPLIRAWYGRTYVENMIDFIKDNVDDFYLRVGEVQNQSAPLMFAEKFLPDQNQHILWELYPEPREIVLVRDFRDVICSVLSFNERRGHVAFGRELVSHDEEFVRLFQGFARHLLEYWRRRASQLFLMRYEELILRPVDSLASMLEYLGLDGTSSLITEVLQTASTDTPQLRQHRTSSSPSASIGRWRHDLSPPLQSLCEEVFSDVLREFGYDEDLLAAISSQATMSRPITFGAERTVRSPFRKDETTKGQPVKRRAQPENHSKYPTWPLVAPLPPRDLMMDVGARDIENFFIVGDAWAQVITKYVGSNDTILDIGCGCGRTARFLINLPDIQYIGFDIVKRHVEWCSTNLTSLSRGRFRFYHCDGKSNRYNPGGQVAASEYRFPAADASVDVVFAASVFTHLKEHDAVHYLEESHRVLKPGGRAVFSIHMEPREGVYSGNESRIDIDPAYFVGMAECSGLPLRERIGNVCGQELFLFEKAL
jgi:SAM-dependent methyltransferase